ncbi:MAG: hypothetical protein AB1428_10535 [Bacteroidota bacterium]
MLKRQRVLPFLTAVLGLSAAWFGTAVAGSGGSAYSILGIGDIRYAPGSRGAGMGYTGIGLAPSLYINAASPASWFRIDRTRLEGAALYEGFNSTDGARSRYLARLDFHGALLAIPISPSDGLVLVGGFLPYSQVGYDTYTTGLYSRVGTDTVTMGYRLHHIGSGGITRAVLGASCAPAQAFSVGASLNYMFGTLSRSSEQIPVQSGFSGGTFTSNQSISGLNFTTGVLVSTLGGITESLRPLSLGAVVTTRANLHTIDDVTYDYTFERDTSAAQYKRIGVPFSFGVGIGYQASERWTIAVDYTAQPWSESDFEGATPAGIRDSYRIGIGAERAGSRESVAPWLDRLSYRLGFTFHQTYFNPGGHPVDEWAVTAGMAFPLSGESRLNVAAEYGSRGATEGGLIRDRIFRMTFSLNISDLWFVRYEED